ncbi:MAG TPA: aminotransferase class V-fold PLP-dependent enzyme [Ktedonobacteraceae bacterium]|nr:aminotransferase class V-fold PLP-dependent enzyme [Ktedonobacteraceae bacterium]
MQHMDSPSRSLDESLQALRDACPLLKTHIYLANCSQGPLANPVRATLESFIDDWAAMGMHWDAWIEEVERARAAFAALIGAQPGEIAVGSSVSQLVSSLASALANSPSTTSRRIITSVAEFPGVAHAWLALRAAGYTVDVLQGRHAGIITEDDLVESLDTSTTLVSCPHVCYANGMLLDLERVAQAAHAHGSLIFVDAYQSIGTIPIDVKASGVDFLAAGTLKYLLGTAGIAFLYVNPALLETLHPTVTGWFGRVEPFAFDPFHLDYASSAARFDLGTPNIVNAYAARAAMQLIRAAGVERIRQQIQRLSALAYRLAPQLGLHILGPQDMQHKGTTTALQTDSAEQAHQLEATLRQRGIIVSARNQAIRLAPHGFTREEELEQAMQAVATMLHNGK